MTNRDKQNKPDSSNEPNTQAGSSRNQEQKQRGPNQSGDSTGDVERPSNPNEPRRTTPKNPGLPQYDDRPNTSSTGGRKSGTPEYGDAMPSDPRRLDVSDQTNSPGSSPDVGGTPGAGGAQA